MFPSEYQGIAVAVFNFAGAITGTIMTTVLGMAVKHFLANEKTIEDPLGHQIRQGTVYGRVLACGIAFSYLGCCPLFVYSGNEYAKGLAQRASSSQVESRKSS